MEFIITGSGGCVSLPLPLCSCHICSEARLKGIPYSRCGCSLYLTDLSLLIDTPEDIGQALNNNDIKTINYLLFSHSDPDHTLGMRVIEHLRLSWLKHSINKNPINPITILCRPKVMNEINQISTKFGPIMDYYKDLKLVEQVEVPNFIQLNDIKITFIDVPPHNNVTIFVFEQNGKKLIYAPCDVKPFPNHEIFNEAQYLIIGDTILGNVLKDNFVLEENNPLRNILFVLEEISEIKAKYNINKVIMTHIEEEWGKSYDDYLLLEKELDGISFAYDGMKIVL